MVVSGLVLEEIGEGERGLLNLIVDPTLVRIVHRNLAKPFALVLGIMIASGSGMWLLPKVMKRVAK